MPKDTSKMLQIVKKRTANIKSGAETLANRVNDWQVVSAFLKNRVKDIVLTPLQQEKMRRYKYVYEQLSTGKILDKDVAAELSKQFDIEIYQAWEDVRDAKEIYTEIFDINKAWELKLALDMNLKMLQKANASGDLKAYAALEKNRAKLLELVETKDENPAEDFAGHTNLILFDPVLIGAAPVDIKAVNDYINQKRKTLKADQIEDAEVIDDAK
jgi:hypothetical protein